MSAVTLKLILCCTLPIYLPGDTVPFSQNWYSGEESSGVPRTIRWAFQRPDLFRYNRVEGFSPGVRAQFRPQSPLGPISVTGMASLGLANLKPNARLDFTRETLQHGITVSVFHELTAIDERAGHLRLGNSITALVAGRDDGDYYRRSGTSLEWAHSSREENSLRIRVFGEYHRPAKIESDFTIWGLINEKSEWRPNVGVDTGWFLGSSIEFASKWGSDPLSPHGAMLVSVEGGAGTAEYGRANLLGSLDLPIVRDMRISLEAGIGTSVGDLPLQRGWYLGGPSTLRGFPPRILGGVRFARVRGEIARSFSVGDLSFFADGAWVPYDHRFDVETDDHETLFSVGSGLSILDQLIHLDVSWNLRYFRLSSARFDAYLDLVPF